MKLFKILTNHFFSTPLCNPGEFYTNKKDIIKWLDKHELKKYTLVPDEQYGYVVDIESDVSLSDKDLIHIPVKFNKVGGYFDCSHNKLTTLEFCPQIVKGDFLCNNNLLTSLEFCPQKIAGDFSCHYNKLTSLEFSPQEVGGYFSCSYNKLTSLEFSPQEIGGGFHCHNNQLISLEFSPKAVGGNFDCDNNKLISLEFCPQTVGGNFHCYNNQELGELQDINDFSVIYQEHLKYKEKKALAEKLNNELEIQIKSSRIKI